MRQHRPIDDTAIRCTECRHEVDEFTAVAKGWRYWSEGTSLLPYRPECVHESSHPTLPRTGECLSFSVAAPVARILDFDPAARPRVVATR